MKGYVIDAGYMGYVDGEYELFATEEEYYEYMAAQSLQQKKKDFLYTSNMQLYLVAHCLYIQ